MASTPIKPKAVWSQEEVTSMVAKLSELSDGNTADNGFKGPAWQAVADTLADALKTKDSCSSKFQRLKKEYKEVKFLRDLSGFGWDEESDTVTAELQVWDDVLRTRPELHKWRRTSFPWFEQMLEMFGDRLAVGKHAFSGGQALGNNDDNDEDTTIDQPTSSALQKATPNSTPASAFEVQTDFSEFDGTPCPNAKRKQEAAQPYTRKRQKATGISSLQDMAQGLDNVADAIRENTIAMLKPIKEEAEATIQGQAQMRVQTEECLTPSGELIMIAVLADVQAARTYLVLQKPAMRREWIRGQLQLYSQLNGGAFWEWFVDLDGAA